jgi:poly-gamma-glutamate synthesis protein (capsule biosynthesis protein)
MSDTVNLFILGDVCSAEGVRELFEKEKSREIFGRLTDRLRQADIALSNLECVLSEDALGIEKIGPVLLGKPRDAEVLASVGINLVSVANNHIGDCGPQGVMDTLAACRAAGICTVGAGENSAEARKPVTVHVNGITVGVMAFAEHEFNAATSRRPGANIFNPLIDLESIAEFKSQCDFLVILYHGGIEHYQYPSPRLQEACRSMVRHGADIVLCQHSHVIGAAEEYRGGNILYGQGNALYGHRVGKAGWNKGLAVSIALSTTRTPKGTLIGRKIEYLPIGCDPSGRVDFLSEEEERTCLKDFEARSQRCHDEIWLAQSWGNFVDSLSKTHLPHVLGFGRLATKLNRLTNGLLIKLLYSRHQRLVSMNVIRCTAHREVLEASFARSVYGQEERQ